MINTGGTFRDRSGYGRWHNLKTRTYQPKCGSQKRVTQHYVPPLAGVDNLLSLGIAVPLISRLVRMTSS